MEKQQLVAEMRPVECDFSGEGSSEKRKSREDELRDGISVDHKGLMGKERFRFQLPLRPSTSEPPVSSALGRTGTLLGGHRIPVWSPGPQNRHGGNHRRVPFPPLLVPKEGTYWHQQAADTLR